MKNLNTIKNNDWVFDLVSAFYSAEELLAISSKQHTTESKKLSKASCHSIQRVQYISFTFFRLSFVKRSSIHFSNANCLLGELLKNCETSSADCIIMLISWCCNTSPHIDLTYMWCTVCVECFRLLFSNTSSCTFWFTCHCFGSIISLPSKKF